MFDKRWQIVLNCLGEEGAPFSQGTLCNFRHRLITHNMDVTLLEHTVHITFPFIQQSQHSNNYDFAAQYSVYGPPSTLNSTPYNTKPMARRFANLTELRNFTFSLLPIYGGAADAFFISKTRVFSSDSHDLF